MMSFELKASILDHLLGIEIEVGLSVESKIRRNVDDLTGYFGDYWTRLVDRIFDHTANHLGTRKQFVQNIGIGEGECKKEQNELEHFVLGFFWSSFQFNWFRLD